MPFVAVHVGAGRFDESDFKRLKTLCQNACDKGMELLKNGLKSDEIIATVISILEDSPLTNAGTGSCLTYNGMVECDASMMNGNGEFASVGAVTGIKNPVRLVHQLMIKQSKGLMPLGRIPPMCLCGSGAYQWAKENGISTCHPDQLITDRAKEIYLDHMEKLKSKSDSSSSCEPYCKKPKYSEDVEEDIKLDTVGAVCIDSFGLMSSGCSSGGISLKHSGRIGQAGIYGCGCWAGKNLSNDGQHSQIATSASGVGEYLIKTQLAKELATAILDQSLSVQDAFQQKFMDCHLLKYNEPKHAGIICLHVLPSGTTEFSWAHSTDNMLIAYNSGHQAKVFLSKSEESLGSKNRIVAGWLSVD